MRGGENEGAAHGKAAEKSNRHIAGQYTHHGPSHVLFDIFSRPGDCLQW